MEKTVQPMDAYLQSYADKYAGWRSGGSFTFSSKVIPVQESLVSQPWILPSAQVMEIVKQARSFALTDCVCRTHYSRCDKPRDVCLLIDELSDRAVEKGKARRIPLDEVAEVLKRAADHGLVHMTLYMPGHRVYAVCSCCACCCHDLQLLLQYNRSDLVARSDYLAETDAGRCNSCGLCVDRCVFGARKREGTRLVFEPEACLGCGLCVPACPENATVMTQRE